MNLSSGKAEERSKQQGEICEQRPDAGWWSYLGSTARMRKAGLLSDSRSRFTGHCFSWGRKGLAQAQTLHALPASPAGQACTHPAAHDVPERLGRCIGLHRVPAGVGERDPETSVQKSRSRDQKRV